MLRQALAATGIPILGVLPRRDSLHLPDRHLGLVLPDEISGFDRVVAAAAETIEDYVDLNALLSLSVRLPPPSPWGGVGVGGGSRSDGTLNLPPLGQRIAVARDDAFAFLYTHWLTDWREQGAELSFFSPLAGEPPAEDADAIFLPGGYPELHAQAISQQHHFMTALRAFHARGTLIYGECGGFMVLGETLTDASGATHPMAGLLPISTRIDRPRRTLGYRRLTHDSPLPWPKSLTGHEFHYSSSTAPGAATLFSATDALGTQLPPSGAVIGRVMGSYMHVIDVAHDR